MITTEQAEKVKEIVSSFDDDKKKAFLDKYNSLDTDKKEIVIGRLLSSSSTEKKTPIDYSAGFKERSALTESDIRERGTIASGIKESFSSPNAMRKGVGVLQTIGAPFTAIQAGISNPALLLQDSEKMYSGTKSTNTLGVMAEGVGRLLKESGQGFSGQKLGEYGDIYRNAIPNKALGQAAGAVGGLTLDIAGPITALKTVQKSFGSISRMSDAGILRAGDSLVKATKEAEKFAGGKLNEAFKGVDSAKVDAVKFLDEASKLPEPLIKKMEDVFGNLDVLAQNMTVGKLREFKQFLGKYNPSAFGKETRGLLENLQADDINKAYAATKKLLSESVVKSAGQKSADKLLKLEEAFTEVSRASDSVKRTVVDPILLKATRGGSMAGKMVSEGDVTARTALNTLKRSGPKARQEINRAVRALENFNRVQAFSKFGKRLIGALAFGGAAGAIGSSFISDAQRRSGE